jgi:hypothetical protein
MRSEVSNPHEFTMKRFGIHHIHQQRSSEENVLQVYTTIEFQEEENVLFKI